MRNKQVMHVICVDQCLTAFLQKKKKKAERPREFVKLKLPVSKTLPQLTANSLQKAQSTKRTHAPVHMVTACSLTHS